MRNYQKVEQREKKKKKTSKNRKREVKQRASYGGPTFRKSEQSQQKGRNPQHNEEIPRTKAGRLKGPQMMSSLG
jgi:hypothetical protein